MATVAISLAVFASACGSTAPPKPESSASFPVGKIDAATAGSVTGRVLFQGKAPVMPELDMASNPNCEKQHRIPAKAETVVVNRNGTLRNVFVWIKDGLPKARWTPPSEPAVLAQTGCVYAPHMLGVMEDQPVEILNNDPVNHNVHAECRLNPSWNESQPPRAEHKIKQFASAEVMFPMTCGVHPWMRSWVAVSPHPFFAVTGDDGAFTLKGVPPGSYTIEAIQEQLGKKEGKLTVAPNGNASIEFTYGS